MRPKLSVYLVRHGESAANLDNDVNRTMADHVIPLSPAGHEQAREAGGFLADYLLAKGDRSSRRMAYVSPYRRTRQTWAGAQAGMAAAGLEPMPSTESIFLRELEFGLFDGVPDKQLPIEFPREYAHYAKNKQHGGEFYARMPSGESRCDVAQRVHQFFGTLHRDHERHGVTEAFVFSHGVTIRTFAMMWLGLSPEWIEQEPNPWNCSVRLIEGGADLGYIHAGHHRKKASAQETREEGVIETPEAPLPEDGPCGPSMG